MIKMLRVGLFALLVFSVLSFGAVDVWSQSILEITAALLFVWWAVIVFWHGDANIEWNPLNWPLLGFVAIGLLQLLFHGTAYPFLTRRQLLMLSAYFLFFFLAAQAFRSGEDLSKLAWFVILFGFAISLFAIVQHFTSPFAIYWSSSLKVKATPFGPYVNRNDFAGFVELTLPTGLALMAFRGMRRDAIPLTTLLTIVPISALVLSGSRGGIVCFIVEIGVLAALVRNQRVFQGQRVIAVALAAAAALALVSWVGASMAIQRFSELESRDPSISRRISMSAGAAHIFFDHPLKGSGLGTFVAVYPKYETAYDGRIVDHAHDDYVEMLAETGLLGGLCGVAFLWVFYRDARKSFKAEQGHFSQGLHAGAIVAVCGLLLHSFVDFNLHIPANALLFLLQVSLATSPPLTGRAMLS